MKYVFRLLSLTTLFLVNSCASMLLQPSQEDAVWAQQQFDDISLQDLHNGRSLYVKSCAGCHHLHAPHEFSAEAWPEIILRMASDEDVNIPEHEQKLIAAYLAAISHRLEKIQN